MRDPVAELIDALAQGPRNFYDLEDHLLELGYDLGADPDGALDALIEQSGRIIELEDAVVVDPVSLFDGTTFTVDFSESHDLGDHRADLLLVDLVAESHLPLLIDGEPTGLITHDKGYRLHHPRWLHLTEPGYPTAFRIANGVIDVVTRFDEEVTAVDASRISFTFTRLAEEMAESKLPMELEPILFEIAVGDGEPAFKRVLPPITDLIVSAGLEYENMMIVPAGFDWDGWLAEQAAAFEEE